MTTQQLRESLKIDLGMTVTNYDTRLDQIIASSMIAIEDAGATLDLENAQHCQVIIIYSAWMWRRRDTGAPMPAMVRRALNNLVFGQKMAPESEEA